MTSISHIVLELAREKGHPLGDRGHGYHLYLPLDDDGLIDKDAFPAAKPYTRVRRFRPGQDEAHGQIVHGPGGHYHFRYGEGGDRVEEAGYRLETERFVPGEYVSVREDGVLHTFQVISVKREI
jgi:hypothetical protein